MNHEEKKKIILIVEDEGIISLALSRTVEKFGYRVIAAENGETAVRTTLENHEISLVLMDIDLGKGMDGTEAARRILESRDIPVVFHTSHSERDMVEKVRGITRYGYVIKNTGDFVLQSSIEMAFELFDAYNRIKKSDRRHGNLFDNAPIGIFYSTIDGKIIRVNSEFARILGYLSPEELKETINRTSVAESLYEWPEEREFLIKKALDAAGGWVELERHYRRKDGSVCIVRLDIRLSQDEPDVLEGFFEDITERRMSEKLVAESGEKLHRIISNSSDLICEIDEHGRYTFVSERYEAVLGYKPEELIGNHAIEQMHPDDIERASMRYRMLKSSGGTSVDEWRFKQKDGSWRTFECRSSMYTAGHGTLRTVIISHDITDRRRSEDELKNKNEELEALNEELTAAIEEMESTSEELANANERLVDGKREAELNAAMFHSLFDNMTNGCAVYKVRDNGLKGGNYILRNINKSGLNMEGKIFSGVSGKTLTDLYPQIDESGMIPVLQKVWETGEPGYFPLEIFRDKHRKYFYENYIFRIASGEVVIISNDASRQKSTEEALRNSEGRLRTIVQTIPDLIWLKDGDGVYLACNQMFERFFGAEEKEIVGKNDYDFMSSELADFFRRHDHNAVMAGKPTINEEWITFADDGHRAMLETIKTPMYDEVGTLIGVLGIGRDITERKVAEERIQSLLQEKELVLREVHHRIKNNMNTIKALLVLQSNLVNDPSAVNALIDAANRVQSLMVLYDKLYRTDIFTVLSVRDYLSSLVDEIAHTFPGSVKIEIIKQVDDFILDARSLFPIGIIVNELITNAMKYAFSSMDKGQIGISLKLKDNNAELIVEDNGAGMPESVDIRNAGFGLRLVSILTEQIHGTVRIERNNGTRFILEFLCEIPENSIY